MEGSPVLRPVVGRGVVQDHGAAETEGGYSWGWRWITRPQIRHLITVSVSSD